LTGGTAETRAAAAQALGALGHAEDALALVDLLADSDPLAGAAAVEALGQLGAGAVEAVAPLLKSPDATIRARAAEALGRMKAVDALPVLAVQVGDPVPEVRQWALFALGEMPDPPLDAVVKGLQDTDPAVRIAAVRMVGARRLTVIVRLLLHRFEYGTPPERAVAYATLRTLSGKDLGTTARAWEGWVKEQEAGR
jgi:HEAT repeat protein